MTDQCLKAWNDVPVKCRKGWRRTAKTAFTRASKRLRSHKQTVRQAFYVMKNSFEKGGRRNVENFSRRPGSKGVGRASEWKRKKNGKETAKMTPNLLRRTIRHEKERESGLTLSAPKSNEGFSRQRRGGEEGRGKSPHFCGKCTRSGHKKKGSTRKC